MKWERSLLFLCELRRCLFCTLSLDDNLFLYLVVCNSIMLIPRCLQRGVFLFIGNCCNRGGYQQNFQRNFCRGNAMAFPFLTFYAHYFPRNMIFSSDHKELLSYSNSKFFNFTFLGTSKITLPFFFLPADSFVKSRLLEESST